jgi:hypothetical protein
MSYIIISGARYDYYLSCGEGEERRGEGELPTTTTSAARRSALKKKTNNTTI